MSSQARVTAWIIGYGLRVKSLESRVQGSGFRVKSLRSRVKGLRFGVLGLGFRGSGLAFGLKVVRLGSRVNCVNCRV
jgi:hypothetical protein